MNANAKRGPMAADVTAGLRVRQRRLELGLSQGELGQHLGVTFQQVQKYEKGANRMGASRLSQIAKTLKVEPSYFFDVRKEADGSERQSFVDDLVSTRQGIELARAFTSIKSERYRLCVLELARALAAARDEEKPADTRPTPRNRARNGAHAHA